MGKVTIQPFTTKEPLQMIGYEAGICWESDVSDEQANIKRAVDCIDSDHGRVLEFPDIYLTIEGYSARVVREFYTHISGGPTRLQSSTRYVNAETFKAVEPSSVKTTPGVHEAFNEAIETIRKSYTTMLSLGVPKEDAAMILPLGMETKFVDRCNLRHLIDMSRQRMCTRAYWEYRRLFNDIRNALAEYSTEWAWIVETLFYPKCGKTKECPEKRGCGKYPKATKAPDRRLELLGIK